MNGTAGPQSPEHNAAFFRTEDYLREHVADYVGEGLLAGDQVIVIASGPRIDALEGQLNVDGIPFADAVDEGRLLLLDAEDILAVLKRAGMVSVPGFRGALGRFIDPRIKQRIYGEFVSILAQRGELETALAIEALGHELAHVLQIPVLCGYDAIGGCVLSDEDMAKVQALHDRTLIER